eukprot:gb/GECG01004052.1/.p1 GENE.gb/GECG01004052.1/~~gb/GECG01004052.1/.p1  ORF type:complete len:1373 (+),score=137.13 gb/GECG01004052.1/:1-4119(+)
MWKGPPLQGIIMAFSLHIHISSVQEDDGGSFSLFGRGRTSRVGNGYRRGSVSSAVTGSSEASGSHSSRRKKKKRKRKDKWASPSRESLHSDSGTGHERSASENMQEVFRRYSLQPSDSCRFRELEDPFGSGRYGIELEDDIMDDSVFDANDELGNDITQHQEQSHRKPFDSIECTGQATPPGSKDEDGNETNMRSSTTSSDNAAFDDNEGDAIDDAHMYQPKSQWKSEPKRWLTCRALGPLMCSILLPLVLSITIGVLAFFGSNAIDKKNVGKFSGWRRIGGGVGGTFYSPISGPPSSCKHYTFSDSRESVTHSTTVLSPIISDAAGNVYFVVAVLRKTGKETVIQPRLNQLDVQGDRIIDSAILPDDLPSSCSVDSLIVDLVIHERANAIVISVMSTNVLFLEGETSCSISGLGVFSANFGKRLAWYDIHSSGYPRSDFQTTFVPYRMNTEGKMTTCDAHPESNSCNSFSVFLLGQQGSKVQLWSMKVENIQQGNPTISHNWARVLSDEAALEIWDIKNWYLSSLNLDSQGHIAVISFPMTSGPRSSTSIGAVSVNLTRHENYILWRHKHSDQIRSNIAVTSNMDVSFLISSQTFKDLVYVQYDVLGNIQVAHQLHSLNESDVHPGVLIARHPSNTIYCQQTTFINQTRLPERNIGMGVVDSSGNVRWDSSSVGAPNTYCVGYPIVDDIHIYLPVVRLSTSANNLDYELQKRKIIDGTLEWSVPLASAAAGEVRLLVALAMIQFERIGVKTVGVAGSPSISVMAVGCKSGLVDRIWDEEFTFLLFSLVITIFVVRLVGGCIWCSIYPLVSNQEVDSAAATEAMVLGGLKSPERRSLKFPTKWLSRNFTYCSCYRCCEYVSKKKSPSASSDLTNQSAVDSNYGSTLPWDVSGRCLVDANADPEFEQSLREGRLEAEKKRRPNIFSAFATWVEASSGKLLSTPSAASFPWQFPAWSFFVIIVIVLILSSTLVSQRMAKLRRETTDPFYFYSTYLIDRSISPESECGSTSVGACYCQQDSGNPRCSLHECDERYEACTLDCSAILRETGNCAASLFDYQCDCNTGCLSTTVTYNFTHMKTPGLGDNLEGCRSYYQGVAGIVWGITISWIVSGGFIGLIHILGSVKAVARKKSKSRSKGEEAQPLSRTRQGSYSMGKSSPAYRRSIIQSLSLAILFLLVVGTVATSAFLLSSKLSKGEVCTGAKDNKDPTDIPTRRGIDPSVGAFILYGIPGCIYDSSWTNQDIEGDLIDAAGLAAGVQLLCAGILIIDWVTFAIQASIRMRFHTMIQSAYSSNKGSRRIVVSPRILMPEKNSYEHRVTFCCTRSLTDGRFYGCSYFIYSPYRSCICCGPGSYTEWEQSQRGIRNPYFTSEDRES